ncbi:hypothetical protein FJ945_26075 [Mesorhizobium sp. B2-4-9]|nr:hypothetical protein FJ945_26075 [Mesorhizobium sp. B2-4-9]
MQAIYFRNANLQVEVLDGEIIDVRNLSTPGGGSNLKDHPMIQGGRLAVVYGEEHPGLTFDFDSPGDISRNSIDAKE